LLTFEGLVSKITTGWKWPFGAVHFFRALRIQVHYHQSSLPHRQLRKSEWQIDGEISVLR